MLDHAKMTQMYPKLRNFVGAGKTLGRGIFVNLLPDGNFELKYVISKCYSVAGSPIRATATNKERDKWTYARLAHIHKDRVQLFPSVNNTRHASHSIGIFLADNYDVTLRSSSTITIAGLVWFPLKRGDKQTQKQGVYAGKEGLFILSDGSYAPASPPLLRTHNKDERKLLNQKIAAVRRFISLREKFGGFNSVNWDAALDNLSHKTGLRSGEKYASYVAKLFDNIDPANYLSAVPLLAEALVHTRGWWHARMAIDKGGKFDLAECFEGYLVYVREHLRKHHQAVSFTPATDIIYC